MILVSISIYRLIAFQCLYITSSINHVYLFFNRTDDEGRGGYGKIMSEKLGVNDMD